MRGRVRSPWSDRGYDPIPSGVAPRSAPRRASIRSRRRGAHPPTAGSGRVPPPEDASSQRRKVSCGLQADTTVARRHQRAVVEADPAHGVARAADLDHPCPRPERAAGRLERRRAACRGHGHCHRRDARPWRRGASRGSAHRDRNRRTRARCPTPSDPVIAPGPRMISLSKNSRSTSAALRRLQRRRAGVPASLRRSASLVSPTTDGGSAAASKIIRTAGIAASA